jgi:hypothetical protein
MIIFSRRPYGEARLGQVGNTIYVHHPDDADTLTTIPHPTEVAASEAFEQIRKAYFSPYIGWKVSIEREEVNHAEWVRPKPTAEERARFEADYQVFRQGYAIDGASMVMVVYADAEVIEAALERAREVTALHVLIGLEDNVGRIRRPGLLSKLAKGAAPRLVELTFESPWVPRWSLEKLPLKVPPALLERLERFAAVGAGVWPTGAKPKRLERLRLQTRLTAEDLAQIASVKSLRTLQIALNQRVEATARAELPAMQLDELTVENLDDVAAMIQALLDAKSLPPLVQLQGWMKRWPELRAAISRWQREAAGSTLRFGNWPMESLDAEMRGFVEAAGIERFESPLISVERPWWAPFKSKFAS